MGMVLVRILGPQCTSIFDQFTELAGLAIPEAFVLKGLSSRGLASSDL